MGRLNTLDGHFTKIVRASKRSRQHLVQRAETTEERWDAGARRAGNLGLSAVKHLPHCNDYRNGACKIQR